MNTDPAITTNIAARLLADRIRDGERERDAALVHAWDQPLVDLVAHIRVPIGALLVRLGQVVQGATCSAPPAPAHQ